MSDVVKGYLRWVLGAQGAPEVRASDVDVDAKTLMAAGIASFSLALERYFPHEPSSQEAADLVARVRQTWVEPEGLNPVLAERVIFNAYGEEGLVDDVPAVEVARVENLLTYGIRRILGIEGADLEAFIDEVVEMMNEPAGD